MIEFKLGTWLALAILMALASIVARYAEISFEDMLHAHVALICASLLVLSACYWGLQQRLDNKRYSLTFVKIQAHLPADRAFIKLFQIVLFFLSYSIARMLVSREQ